MRGCPLHGWQAWLQQRSHVALFSSDVSNTRVRVLANTQGSGVTLKLSALSGENHQPLTLALQPSSHLPSL